MASEAKLSPEGLWQRFLTAVAPKLSAHVITNWLRPVRCSDYDGEVVTLQVRDEFFRHWLADHYGEFVREQLGELLGSPVSVVVVVNSGAPGTSAANDDAVVVDGAQAEPAEAQALRSDAAPKRPRRAGRTSEGRRRSESASAVPSPGEALELAAAEHEGIDELGTLSPAEPDVDASPEGRCATADGPPAGSDNAAAPPGRPRPARAQRIETGATEVSSSLSSAAPAGPASKRAPRASRARARSAEPNPQMAMGALNARYTFDSFVEGPSNQFASAACRAAADEPGHNYNPLFLFGGVGLGKTHLLCAIGHEIKRRNKAARVHYTSSEQFQSDVINAILSKRLEQFRAHYKTGIDVLLMDDIQLISGKERTQHEIFQLFNAMFDSNRQIVVTSDKLPHEIPDIQERLRNRFQWGLIADVQPPEVETRIAILRKKAELEGFSLPNDVAFFLARAIRNNVRELEGALVRVCAQASLTHSPLTLDYVRASLSDILQHAPADMTAESIQRAVCQFYSVRLTEMKGSGRRREVVRARQVAMFLCRKHLGASYPEIGARFGKKDHTTVMSACNRMADAQNNDAALRGQLLEVEQRIERPAD